MLFKPSDPWPRSHYDVIDYYHTHYDEAVATGKYQPFLYPWGMIGPLGVIIYLLLPYAKRPWLKKCRYLAFAWITSFAIYTTAYTRARELVSALVLGLLSAWSVIWFGAILVCNDPQTDFMRIERTTGVFGSDGRSKVNGIIEQKKKDTGDDAGADVVNGRAGPRDRHGEFAWQPYPLTPFIERLDWVLDLLCSFRGVGWNFCNSNIAPPPKHIQEQLLRNSGASAPKKHCHKPYSGQAQLYTSRQELLKDNAWKVFKGYMILDGLKTAMMYDPYFWGQIDRAAPPSSFLPNNAVFRNIYHRALTMLGVQYALQSIFALGPLLFCGLLTPSLLGARAEVWSHPPSWGSYSIVLEKGLAGWWGNWWHQTFRFAFSEPSRKMIEAFGMDKKSPASKAVQLFVAFFLSGVVHASGVYTCAGPTRPITGSMTFFLLQAVGIFAEMSLTKISRKTSLAQKIPAWVKKSWTFLYVHVWFYYTAHLLCDDFARGGVWLFEPVPISLLRGVGLGADERDGWWCWNPRFVRWYSGDTWWDSGIAL
ncbi:membrane bound o-acyl transferase family domain-containing [Pyrenophora seminiperda CCB06]|uniref:Membrane bound o-acyl transferase family domain-containing n=1 Tax=Pyrenophora seminiperda CCB06 TaxID=1302712 RepID=A0A3M7M8W9_9PLEO|nr:membrane bound o-acyl transferase family domain-containing [Pyrenophora seminiperda CCB06]